MSRPDAKYSSRGRPPRTEPTVQQWQAIDVYIQTGSIKTTANILRIPYETVKCWFMREDYIKNTIAEKKKEFSTKVGYTQEKSMMEAEEGMELARSRGNAMAFVKAVELRAKISGFLVDKIENVGTTPFAINIIGLDGQRVAQSTVVDVTPKDKALPQTQEEKPCATNSTPTHTGHLRTSRTDQGKPCRCRIRHGGPRPSGKRREKATT